MAKTECYTAIDRNRDPQQKILTQLEEKLQQYHTVTLKGDPGTGKTYTALQHVSKPGKKAFFGKKDLEKWLASHSKTSQEKSVLIIDEANMSVPGYWDFLAPLNEKSVVNVFYKNKCYPISNRHKVIFTCNPEHYPSRHCQDVLQNSPQIYVKSWTREKLKKHVLQPILTTALSAKELNTDQSATLETLLSALQITCYLLGPPITANMNNMQTPLQLAKTAAITNEQLSLRDAQQLILRWSYHLQQQKARHPNNYQQAAYEACIMEWGHRFDTPGKNALFKQQMKALFQPHIPDMQHFTSAKHYSELLRRMPKDYFLGTKQREWLMTVYEDMQLAKELKVANPIDKTPIIKAGVLLEGGSGLGKTSMLLESAHCMGLQLCTPEELLASKKGEDFSQHYVPFTLSANRAQDRLLLRKAFDSGCKVILDELNLDPSIESLLNQLLTGKTRAGKPATTLGFYVLASQNSSKHSGSKSSSLALKNRLHVLCLTLSKTDLEGTTQLALPKELQGKAVGKKMASDIVEDFLTVQEQHTKTTNTRTFLQGLRKIAGKKDSIAKSVLITFVAPQRRQIDEAAILAELDFRSLPPKFRQF